MWYLMVEGHRCPTLPYDPEQPDVDVDRALLRWARNHAVPDHPGPAPHEGPHRTRTLWWGPD